MSVKDITRLDVVVPDEQKVANLAERIDLMDPSLSVSYGADAMQDISSFADSVLSKVRARDVAPVSELLSGMLQKVQELDISVLLKKKSVLAALPLIGQVFDAAKTFVQQFDTIADQVNQVSEKLDRSMEGLIRDVEMLDQLYGKNLRLHQSMTDYIAAGRMRVEQARTGELPPMQKMANESGNPLDAQKLRDFNSMIDRFEKRLHDLELSRTLTLQTAPQLRLIQSNDQALAEKIQTSILTTIPIWKNQFILAIALQNQRDAAKMQKQVTDTTNKLLRKNAELLETTSIETAREVERSIVDIDTLKDIHNRLLNSIEETLKISQEGRQNRQIVEKDLQRMEKELFTKLADIADRQKKQADREVNERIASDGAQAVPAITKQP